MTAQYPVSGAYTVSSFGWESTFGSLASPLDKSFGQGLKISTFDIDNDAEFIYAIGSQDMQRQIAKKFNGSWSTEFIYSDPWFLRAILGSAPVDAGATPYTHTWNTSQGISNTQTSMSINLATTLATNSDKNLLGCIANSMTMTCAVGETIKVKLDGWYANLAKDTSLTGGVSPTEDPMSFAYASLAFPSAIADVQSVELSFNRNNEAIFAIGSRFAQTNVAKEREWSIRASVTYEKDSDFLDAVLGSSTAPILNPAEIASLTLTLTNGLTLANQRSIVFTFANVMVTKTSMPISVEDVTKIDIEMRARSVTSIVVSNNTSAAP